MPVFERTTANAIARKRIAAGFETVADGARALGCSRVHLLNVERGAIVPSRALLSGMARQYRVAEKTVARIMREIRIAYLKRELARAESG